MFQSITLLSRKGDDIGYIMIVNVSNSLILFDCLDNDEMAQVESYLI